MVSNIWVSTTIFLCAAFLVNLSYIILIPASLKFSIENEIAGTIKVSISTIISTAARVQRVLPSIVLQYFIVTNNSTTTIATNYRNYLPP